LDRHQLAEFSFQSGAGLGLLLSLAGTFCFSLGSIVSSRIRMAGLPICGNMGWAMLYGVMLLCIFVILRGKHFAINFSLSYIYSLAYLAIVASVISFAAYFALHSRISTEQAAYTTVLFPVVALTLSTFFEGHQWTIFTVLGIMLIIAGNTLVLRLPLRHDYPTGNEGCLHPKHPDKCRVVFSVCQLFVLSSDIDNLRWVDNCFCDHWCCLTLGRYCWSEKIFQISVCE
jgi:uncharacterized membrane protein